MSGKVLEVRLNATDNASAVFARAGNAAKSMGEAMEQSSSRASRAWANMEANQKKYGASVGILATAGALMGKSFRDQEVALNTLERGYGDAAQELQRYAQQIQDTTNYSNDAAVAAANVFRTLGENYGFTADQVEELIQISADLAATTGISLVDAATRVQSAMRGEAEAAEYLGLTLNDHALGIDRLAASTSEYEKSQIRFAALQEQSAFAMGAAEEQAGGLYGKLYELKNGLNDTIQGIAATNPMLAELGAFAADNAVQIAALTLAAGQLGSTLKALGAISAAKSVAGILGSPGVLGGAGVAAGGVLGGLGLVGWMLAHPEDTGISEDIPYFKVFQTEAEQLELTIGRVSQAGNQYAADTGNQAGQIVTNLTAMSVRYQELLNKWENPGDASTQQIEAWAHEREVILEDLGQQFADNSAHYLTGLADDINTITGYTGDGAALMQEQLATLNQQFESGWLNPSEYASQVDVLASSVAYYDEQAQNGVKTTQELGEAMGTTSGYAAAHAAGMERQAKLAEDVAKAHQDLANQFDLTTAAYMGTTSALEAGFRTAVGNTSAIAQQSQAVADWAENLIGAQGAYSELDKLVAEGRIGGQSGVFDDPSQYAAAQRAYNSILKDNEDIQRDILAIQAMQAPTIAAMVDAQQDYIQSVREGSGAEQMRALAYMDSATAAQALQLAQGYIEDQDVFGPMISQAAALNPYLAIILEDMGIISRGSQGEIRLEGVDNAQSALDTLTRAIAALTQAQWIATFDGDPAKAEAAYEQVMGYATAWDELIAMATLDAEDQASAKVYAAIGALNEFDGRVATSYITTYVQTIGDFIGSGTSPLGNRHGGVAGYAHGGVIAELAEGNRTELLHFATGGVLPISQNGIYDIPVGTYVSPHNAVGDTGNHPSIVVNISGPFNNTDEAAMDRWAQQRLIPAFRGVLQDTRRGQVS